jgi:hypothetical protein
VCDIAYCFQTNHSRATVTDFVFLPALVVRVSGKAAADPLFLVVYWRLNSHGGFANEALQVLFCSTLVSTHGNGLEQSENTVFCFTTFLVIAIDASSL